MAPSVWTTALNTHGFHTSDEGTASPEQSAVIMLLIVLGSVALAVATLGPLAERAPHIVPQNEELSVEEEAGAVDGDGQPEDADASTDGAVAPDTGTGDDGVPDPNACPVERIVATAGKVRVSSRKGDDGLALFLPSSPGSSSFRLEGYDGDGHRIPLAISNDEATAGRFRLPLPDFAATGLPSGMTDRLDATGKVTAWVRSSGDASQSPVRLTVMKSARTQTLLIQTSQPQRYVDQSKSNMATGRLLAYDAGGGCIYDGRIDGIKSRGNSTWWASKKPYNIKLDKKADLAGSGEPHRAWCLLADAYDATSLRNLASLRLAKEFGVTESSDCMPCDVWWNGEYRGSYLLTEKIGIWSGGIDTYDLEDEVEDLNMSAPETAVAYEGRNTVTEGEGEGDIRYVEGVATPQRYLDGDLEGLLVEHDGRYQDEPSWFRTSIGVFVMKSPDVVSREMVVIARDWFERAFSCLYAGGGPDEYGCVASDYFDLESLARCSWLYVLSGEPDYMGISSSYFYVTGDGLIHAGPAWDFDLAWYNRNDAITDSPDFQTYFERYALDDGNEELKARISQTNPEVSALVRDVLLGDRGAVSDDDRLRSLAWYWDDRARSREMDAALWDIPEETMEHSFEQLNRGFAERVAHYDHLVAVWNGEEKTDAAGDAMPADGTGGGMEEDPSWDDGDWDDSSDWDE